MNKERKQKVQEKLMRKREQPSNARVFTLSTLTHMIPKYHYTEEGVPVNPDFNNRSFAKKAYKAYLKGQQNFYYRNNLYVVPAVSEAEMNEYLATKFSEVLNEEE